MYICITISKRVHIEQDYIVYIVVSFQMFQEISLISVLFCAAINGMYHICQVLLMFCASIWVKGSVNCGLRLMSWCLTPLSTIFQLYRKVIWKMQCKVCRHENSYSNLRLWCLTSLSTIFQLCGGGKVLLVKKPEYPKKITDLPQVVDKLSHNVVSNTPRLSGVRTHSFSGERHWLHR